MESISLSLFLVAAVVIAITPGPGILYVAARALEGGRAVGLASSLGTGVGGLAHVVAGAVGVSALLLASAELFALLKFLGALYLVVLGWRTWREAARPLAPMSSAPVERRRAFRDGVVVEALNPKTAAFFLAFIPQFVEPARGDVALQFALLGAVSVVLNTAADVVVVLFAVAVRARAVAQGRLLGRLRRLSAALLCGLGVSLALARRP